MTKPLTILGIAGSLRKASFNRSLLRAAQQLAPENVGLEEFDLTGIPVYNQDDEKTLPPTVAGFKNKIRAADAVLFVTPEYNYSVPGVLKNAIDWASRPMSDSAWSGKPAAIIGASMGAMGTSRAQYHLRQILVSLKMPALTGPEIMIASAQDKFDANGNLTDAKARELIARQLEALVAWTRRLSA